MFEEHQLERDYANIDIEDDAFVRLFKFFDTWRWHLDTRITASGKDINPDVLGYIFEQYINDRAQMELITQRRTSLNTLARTASCRSSWTRWRKLLRKRSNRTAMCGTRCVKAVTVTSTMQ